MRIIRVKLTPESKDYAIALAPRLRIRDVSFIEDVYALCIKRGNGLPDDSRCEVIAKHYSTELDSPLVLVRSLVRKRRQVLKELALSSVFSLWLKNNCIENEFDFTERMLTAFVSLHRKMRKAQCLSCHLLSTCAFGKQYSGSVQNILTVIDPDYTKKVHEDCPLRPDMDAVNAISAAAKMAKNIATQHGKSTLTNAMTHPLSTNTPIQGGYILGTARGTGGLTPEEVEALSKAEEAASQAGNNFDMDDEILGQVDPDELPDDDDGPDSIDLDNGARAGKMRTAYRTSHVTGANVAFDDTVVNKLKVTDLALYELSRKLDSLLQIHKKGIYRPVSKLTTKQEQAKIKSIADMPKVNSAQHALPDPVFDAKLAKRELVKKQEMEPEAKKQLLYILLDTSDSMNCATGVCPAMGFMSRASLAASFCLALLRHVRDEQGIAFMRCFEGTPSALRSARTATEFDTLELFVARCRFDGSNTNLDRAIETAAKDIAAARDELNRAEILMITDAADNIDDATLIKLRSALGTTALNVLDVCGTDMTGEKFYAADALQKLADNYYKIDPSKSTLKDMVNLVGGKKKNPGHSNTGSYA